MIEVDKEPAVTLAGATTIIMNPLLSQLVVEFNEITRSNTVIILYTSMLLYTTIYFYTISNLLNLTHGKCKKYLQAETAVNHTLPLGVLPLRTTSIGNPSQGRVTMAVLMLNNIKGNITLA